MTWWKDTAGDWNPMTAQMTGEFIAAMSGKREGAVVVVAGEEFRICHKSVNSCDLGRGRSYYFEAVNSDDVVRISDHWSETGSELKRSKKLNCYSIGSCWWSCKNATKSHVHETTYLSGRYPSRMIGGRVSISKLERSTDES